jgi:chromosome segregation ATPase
MDEDTKLIVETVKIVQGEQLKRRIRELDDSLGSLKHSLAEINEQFEKLNENTTKSAAYLNEISKMNKSAERLGTIMLVLTIVTAIAAALQIVIIMGIFK